MKYRVIYNKGLPKSMLEKIKNREYTLDEIHSMYQVIKRNHDAKLLNAKLNKKEK